jgi:DegV family protein with EDD domain
MLYRMQDHAGITQSTRNNMSGDIRVLVDSVACLPEEVVAHCRIGVIRVRLAANGRTYCDTSESLPPAEVRILQETPTIDTTPWPPEHYAGAYCEAGTASSILLHVVAFSQFTSTISLARAGAALAQEATPGLRVEVFDSASTGMAQGLIAKAAAEAACAERDIDEVIRAAALTRSRVRTLFALDSLRYVARTGRVGGLTTWATSMLRVLPLVGLAQGKERPLGLVRSKAAALRRLIEVVERETTDDAVLHIGVVECGWREQAEEFSRLAKERLGAAECLIAEASPATQVVAGPGMLSVAYYAEE